PDHLSAPSDFIGKMTAEPIIGRLRLLGSALFLSILGFPLSSFGFLSQAMLPQMFSPQRDTFNFTSPSAASNIPVGSPAIAVVEISTRPIRIPNGSRRISKVPMQCIFADDSFAIVPTFTQPKFATSRSDQPLISVPPGCMLAPRLCHQGSGRQRATQ